jgi:hypothetical protein
MPSTPTAWRSPGSEHPRSARKNRRACFAVWPDGSTPPAGPEETEPRSPRQSRRLNGLRPRLAYG